MQSVYAIRANRTGSSLKTGNVLLQILPAFYAHNHQYYVGWHCCYCIPLILSNCFFHISISFLFLCSGLSVSLQSLVVPRPAEATRQALFRIMTNPKHSNNISVWPEKSSWRHSVHGVRWKACKMQRMECSIGWSLSGIISDGGMLYFRAYRGAICNEQRLNCVVCGRMASSCVRPKATDWTMREPFRDKHGKWWRVWLWCWWSPFWAVMRCWLDLRAMFVANARLHVCVSYSIDQAAFRSPFGLHSHFWWPEVVNIEVKRSHYIGERPKKIGEAREL